MGSTNRRPDEHTTMDLLCEDAATGHGAIQRLSMRHPGAVDPRDAVRMDARDATAACVDNAEPAAPTEEHDLAGRRLDGVGHHQYRLSYQFPGLRH